MTRHVKPNELIQSFKPCCDIFGTLHNSCIFTTLTYSESWHLWDPRYIHNSVKAYSGILRTLCNAHILKTLPYLELCYIQNYGILLTWGKLRTLQTSDSLRNSGAKNNCYDSGAISEFSVFLGNTSAKKLPKTKQKPFYITSAMALGYLGILPRAMIWFFNSWD